jgi:hypothetical protein
LETVAREDRHYTAEEGERRREWLGYATKEEEDAARERYRAEKRGLSGGQFSIEEVKEEYNDLDSMKQPDLKRLLPNNNADQSNVLEGGEEGKDREESGSEPDVERTPSDENQPWKEYWQTVDTDA